MWGPTSTARQRWVLHDGHFVDTPSVVAVSAAAWMKQSEHHACPHIIRTLASLAVGRPSARHTWQFMSAMVLSSSIRVPSSSRGRTRGWPAIASTVSPIRAVCRTFSAEGGLVMSFRHSLSSRFQRRRCAPHSSDSSCRPSVPLPRTDLKRFITGSSLPHRSLYLSTPPTASATTCDCPALPWRPSMLCSVAALVSKKPALLSPCALSSPRGFLKGVRTSVPSSFVSGRRRCLVFPPFPLSQSSPNRRARHP
mmetsp:Transcript_34563/g.87272  ORF Transcript_34563/g.87272 Transcript_34563/m.87272 type:complete len:252 (-) Transcript_34563:142-897(-)